MTDLVAEMGVDIASAASVERHDRQSPVAGDGLAGSDIARHGAMGPEPDVHAGTLPLHCVDSTAIVVEGRAVGVASCSGDAAASATTAGVAIRIAQSGP